MFHYSPQNTAISSIYWGTEGTDEMLRVDLNVRFMSDCSVYVKNLNTSLMGLHIPPVGGFGLFFCR